MQLVNATRILAVAQESAEFCSRSPEYSAPYPCSVLVSWTFDGGDSLKKDELELFAKTMCHHVWNVHKKGKTEGEGNERYQLVEEEQGHTCTLEFTLRPKPHPHLLLHWVTLDRPAEGKEKAREEVEGETAHDKMQRFTVMYSRG
ncbi:uncharacterized protein LOC126994398 isoform X3 [Eriocheir sinensis]|nr:uncharacterized protein LOC126994398 isoform X2 [Eriocheir sinensis]XP_050709669.1 uncharacterized protein LOC126994398 isoform X3 [Eriocheir sinensis]